MPLKTIDNNIDISFCEQQFCQSIFYFKTFSTKTWLTYNQLTPARGQQEGVEDENVGGDHREGCGGLRTPGPGRGTRSRAEDGLASGTRHFTHNYREIFF